MSKGFGYKYSGTKGHILGVAGSLPKDPNKLLSSDWEDISHPEQRKHGHWELREKKTGLKIRFDKGIPGKPGFVGEDHYHIYNPNADSSANLYLDKNGNPVSRSSRDSHILPEGE